MQTSTTQATPKKTPYGVSKKEVFFALTSFIPGVMVIYFVLALFNVGGLRGQYCARHTYDVSSCICAICGILDFVWTIC